MRALKLGDTLAAVPALRALTAAFPCADRRLVAEAWLTPIVRQTGFRIDPTAVGEPDVAVNLHGSGPESMALLASMRPRRLVSYGAEGGPVWRCGEHEVARWCRLLTESGIPADPSDIRLAPPPPSRMEGVAVVHPGVSTGARRWPAERWAEVAAALDGPVVVTGNGCETALAADVARRADLPPSAVLAGRTDLRALMGIVAHARVVVCGDTGVSHLASAYGTPSVVLFGPVPPSAWGPPLDGPHIALWAGRTGDPFADDPDPGLLEVTVDQVLAALSRLGASASTCPMPTHPNGRRVTSP